MLISAALAVLTLGCSMRAADSAYLHGDSLVIEPVGMSLRVPPIWLGAPAPPGRNLVCENSPTGSFEDRILTSQRRFPSLLNTVGEWTGAFSAVVDSVMPFTDLVADLGSGPWPGSCLGLHMRVYVGLDLARRIAGDRRGVEAAERFFRPVRRVQVDSAGWRIIRLSWDAHYGDTFGPTHVEFWSRMIRGRDVVFVFMFVPGGDEQLRDRADIIHSVRERAR